MKITSPAFNNGEIIPREYTCEGNNYNPPLEISDVPQNTKSLVVLIDDPDTPMGVTWHHWVLFNIPPTVTKIEKDSIPKGSVEGTGSANIKGYQGPCPPDAKPHRYFFYLYALDDKLNINGNAESNQIREAFKNHLIEEAQLIGIYRGPTEK